MNSNEQKQKIIEIANLVKETSDLYAQCLSDPKSAQGKLATILELESKGDKIQGELDENFQSQKNIPYLALDRATLVRRLDDTLDQIAFATRTLVTYSVGLPDDFSEKIQGIAEDSRQIGACLSDAVELIYTSFKDSLKIATEIEEKRDGSVEIAFKLETDYFQLGDELNWKRFTAVSKVIDRTMKYIAKAKESSEVLQIMAFKYE